MSENGPACIAAGSWGRGSAVRSEARHCTALRSNGSLRGERKGVNASTHSEGLQRKTPRRGQNRRNLPCSVATTLSAASATAASTCSAPRRRMNRALRGGEQARRGREAWLVSFPPLVLLPPLGPGRSPGRSRSVLWGPRDAATAKRDSHWLGSPEAREALRRVRPG